jgi:DNA-binding MarR family transcriptional regulator
MATSLQAAIVNDFVLALNKATGDNTMPSQQITLLLSLYVHGTVNQSELEELTGVKRSSNSRNIAKLGMGEQAWSDEGPKYLENFEDLQNRRLKMVRLTAKGRALVGDCLDQAFAKYEQFLSKKGQVTA